MKDCAIGIDPGGTKIAFGAVDEQGRVLELLRYDTETQGGFGAVTKQVAGGVRQLRGKCSPRLQPTHPTLAPRVLRALSRFAGSQRDTGCCGGCSGLRGSE